MSRLPLSKIYLTGLAALGCSFFLTHTQAMEEDLRGQASGWHIEARDQGNRYYNAGIRYIPQLSLIQAIGTDRFLDLEISLNGYAALGSSGDADDSALELYRLKLRMATEQTETRLGLQKLNFGPAYLLRPLMWFDRLDPRDPLGITDGVYALRFKYNALNNASLWLWGLYGNDEAKGLEIFPTVEEKPEFGGRWQYPVLHGELAFTFHTRRADASPLGAGTFREDRVALDGRWDIEIGLWFESVLQQQKSDHLPFQWTKSMTLGTDYTLPIGNGLYILVEHMATISSENPMGWDDDVQASAFSLNYPMGYLDKLSVIGLCSWDETEYYQYLAWQRTWDNWILNLSLSRYPESSTPQREASARGYGGQMLVIFNH